MKVKKIMTSDVGFCSMNDNLSKAVEIMRQRDCGAVPAVDDEMKPAGMITDRDIALAAFTQNRKPSQIKIADLTGKRILSCQESDDAEDVLKKMRRAKVRRLPVTGEKGALVGIVSLADFILKAPKLKKKVYSVFKSIAKPRPIVLKEVKEETLPAEDK